MQGPDPAVPAEAIAQLTARLSEAVRELTERENTIHELVTGGGPVTPPGSRSDIGMMVENAVLQQAVARKTLEMEAQSHRLAESEKRFAEAFEHAPIGIALVLPDGKWLKVNRALCELVGYSEAELLDRTFQDITHPEDLDLDMEVLRRMLGGEIRSYQLEKRYIHAQGHVVPVSLDVSLARDHDGGPLYFIAHIQDITPRKRAEQQHRKEEERTLRQRSATLKAANSSPETKAATLPSSDPTASPSRTTQ